MALATSLCLSTPLSTIVNEEPSSDSISNDSMTSIHLNKLYKYSQETEMKSYVDATGTIRQYRQSTERALLAQRKIFLRKKLGEGSFSSVREGYDFFHQYKVAIKVSGCASDWWSKIISILGDRYSTCFKRFSRKISSKRIRYLATCSTCKYYQDVRSFYWMWQNIHGHLLYLYRFFLFNRWIF